MVYANIAELKNRLSHYLKLVRSGEPVLVKDRDRVVRASSLCSAPPRQVPTRSGSRAWPREGILRAGRGRVADIDFSSRPRMKRDLADAVLEEREEGH